MTCALVLFGLLGIGAVSARASGTDANMYVYQGGVVGLRGDMTIETESAYGTRETRLLGENAFEQSMRARITGTNWLSAEVWGGLAFGGETDTGDTTEEEGPSSMPPSASGETRKVEQDDSATKSAFSADLYARVLKQDWVGVNVVLGPGFLYDYQETSIPRLRMIVDHQWKRLDLTFSTLAEMPMEEEEKDTGEAIDGEAVDAPQEEDKGQYDSVDLIFSVASSYQVAEWMRLGAEGVLEDTEGFWEDDEAEGGAKLVTGPTASFKFLKRAHARVNMAAVVPVTSNNQTRVPGGNNNDSTGFLGRAAIGYTF